MKFILYMFFDRLSLLGILRTFVYERMETDSYAKTSFWQLIFMYSLQLFYSARNTEHVYLEQIQIKLFILLAELSLCFG